MKNIYYIVTTFTYWGLGKTVLEAAKNCRKSGSPVSAEATVAKITQAEGRDKEEDKPFVDSYGCLNYYGKSEPVEFKGKLSKLLKGI